MNPDNKMDNSASRGILRDLNNGSLGNPDFLSNLSYNIQSPLIELQEVVSRFGKSSLNERQSHFLSQIDKSLHQLLALVDDIQLKETIFSGKLEQEKISFKIVEIISGSLGTFFHKAEEKGLALVYQNKVPGEMAVMGDPIQLTRILNELLSNAIKFTAKGKIIISTRIRSQVNKRAVIECSVTDTGIGMNEQKLKEISIDPAGYQPGLHPGKGAGLAICRNLLDLQQGELHIRTKENAGSVFTFAIEYGISCSSANPAEPEGISAPLKKILVAEPDKLQQFITRNILELHGFEVTMANNAMETLYKIQTGSFDLLLLDVRMAVLDGSAVASLIRQLDDRAKSVIPIVATTTDEHISDFEKYREAGINDCILKPFNEEKLVRTIIRHFAEISITPNNMKDIHPLNESLPTGKLYDLSIIEAVSGGDEEFVKKMVELFIETVPMNLQELNTFVDRKNWDMVSKLAHKLKSTLDSMGIQALKHDVRTVEMTAKNNEAVENIPVLVKRMNLVVECCILQLETEILQNAS
jgi:CheY-like chemotaxis protein/HPt (histidine-containing phosphotransfer) domain-containing protein